jgi:hypothetical protein
MYIPYCFMQPCVDTGVGRRKARAPTANERFLHRGACDLIRAVRVEKHPPALLICAALGRLPNVEGVLPTRFSAHIPISAAGIP